MHYLDREGGERARLSPIASLGLLGVVFAGMLRWTWGRWPDVLIDFGQQLYVAWQLSEGKVLGRDLVMPYGPLSPYVNAAVFRLFGVGLLQLVLFNIAVLAGLVALLLHLLRRAGIGRLAATTAGLVFLLLFAFSQYVSSGNYNYLCPYASDIVHGLGLSLLSLLFLARLGETGRAREAALAGLALGLAFLTKAEIFVAAAPALVSALMLVCTRSAISDRRIASAFALTALFAPLAAFGLLSTAMPAGLALRTTLGSWVPILAGRAADLVAFRHWMGIDDVAQSLSSMTLWTLGWAAALAPAVVAGTGRWEGRWNRSVPAVLTAATVTALVLSAPRISWSGVLRPLPIVLAALLLAELLRILRRENGRDGPGTPLSRDVTRLAGLAFSLLLLFRMCLNARLYHYGFVLAMPGTLAVVAALIDGLPRALGRRGGRSGLYRAFAFALVGIFVWVHVGAAARHVSSKVCAVGSGVDAFLADARGCVVSGALPSLAQRIAPRQTLAVLPEGVMLNYLLRRENPTPYTNFMPPELAVYGEDAIVASFTRGRPDFIVLVRKDLTEWGFKRLGGDYLQGLSRLLAREYEPETLFGSRFDEGFGMILFRRLDASHPGTSPTPGASRQEP